MKTLKCATLCACRLGIACGLVWGVGVFLLAAVTMVTESYGHAAVTLIGNVYAGVEPGSAVGALLGLVWGGVDGFIAAFLFGMIYNALVARAGQCCCLSKKPCCDKSDEDGA